MERITGVKLGRYEVTRPLAEGGMAQVYLGMVRGAGGFERRVVLKVLHSRYLGEADFVKMFLDEGRILARLRHPNVIDVFEVECVDGVPYLAMEFVNGPTINALQKAAIKAGRSRIENYVFLLRQVADALSAAHTLTVDGVPLGLVHRDVSSQNVLVDATTGTAKLIDFGIARMADALHEQTQVGVVKGKPHYLAPEVRAGAPFDARADLYAMGVLLYRCAAGRMPYREADLAQAVPGEPYLPIERVPGLPPGLAEIVRRAMATRPEDRYASAAELSADLRRVHEAAGVDARAVTEWIATVLPGEDDWGRRGESQSGTAHASLQRLVSEPGRAPARRQRRGWAAAVAVGLAVGVLVGGWAGARLDLRGAAARDGEAATYLDGAEALLREGDPAGAAALNRRAAEVAATADVVVRVARQRVRIERQPTTVNDRPSNANVALPAFGTP